MHAISLKSKGMKLIGTQRKTQVALLNSLVDRPTFMDTV